MMHPEVLRWGGPRESFGSEVIGQNVDGRVEDGEERTVVHAGSAGRCAKSRDTSATR